MITNIQICLKNGFYHLINILQRLTSQTWAHKLIPQFEQWNFEKLVHLYINLHFYILRVSWLCFHYFCGWTYQKANFPFSPFSDLAPCVLVPIHRSFHSSYIWSSYYFINISLCNSFACSGTPSVDQDGLKLTEIFLHLTPRCWDSRLPCATTARFY